MTGFGRIFGALLLLVAATAVLVHALRDALLEGALVAVGLAALAAALVARGARRPARELADFVRRVARGEPAPRLAAAGDGPLAELATSLNEMAARLADRFERMDRERSEIHAIVGSMEEGVLAVDAGLRVVLVNAAAARMLGFEPRSAAGRPVRELTRLPPIADILERCLADGRPAVGETLVAGEPHDRVLGLTASPLGPEAAGDQPAWGCVLVLRDLTEVTRLEQVRRDFVVNVSHELKTPLTSLRGFLEAVLEDPSMDETTRRRFLERARANNERMVAIVGDLLSLARIEAETGVPRAEPLDLRELATEARQALAGPAAQREVELQLALPEAGVPVRGDRIGLVTAITNLLDNALKYGPRGTPVQVRVSAEGGEAVLEVADRGPGIPPHEVERIFERFYRLDKNRSRDLGGTGLGLSIVRNVVTAHGGRVSVDSAPGRGSVFRMAIPLQEAPNGPLSSEAPGSSGEPEAGPPAT